MIKLEDKTMTKKQYFIPQVETLPLFNMTALCASGDPAPAPVDPTLNINPGVEATEVW